MAACARPAPLLVDYTLLGQRPSTPDRCDVCGGKLVQREDDNPEALATRLRAYHNKTKPIIELFERKEFVARVDANRAIEVVQADIRKNWAFRPAPEPAVTLRCPRSTAANPSCRMGKQVCA